MKQFLLLGFFCSLLVLFFINSGIAQDDPFGVNENGPITVKSQDVFLLWMEDIGSGNIKSYQKIYRYKPEGIVDPNADPDTMVSKTLRNEDSRPGKYKYVDVATGRFNVDPYDDIVAVWRTSTSNSKIEILIPDFDTTGFFSNSNQITLNAGGDIRQDEEIYVRTGDFDGDSLDEFVVAYMADADSSVHLCLYDVDSTLQATLVTNYSNTIKVLGSSVAYYVKYFVEAADLNNDGIDEIVTCTWETSLTSSALPITIRIYAIENGEFVQKGETQIDVPRFPGSLLYFAMALASGQFDYDEENELVFSTVFKWSNSNASSRHYKIDVTTDLGSITYDNPLGINLEPFIVNNISEFSLATGDLNNDYKHFDEVVFAAGQRIQVIAVNENLDFEAKALINVANGGASDYLQSNNYLKVKDMNMDNREDVVVVKNIVANIGVPKGFEIAFITFTDSTLNTPTLFARLLGDESQNDEYHQYAIAIGNFDGFDFRIGQPRVTRVYGTVEPVVLLNAPPIHFDKFGNNIFDLNTCFPDPVNNCDFWSYYHTSQTLETEVTIENHRDWQVSAGFRLSGEITAAPLGIGVGQDYEFWATYKHGRHFSKDSTSGESTTLSQTILARDDDRIYAIVEDCDVWEYPVFHGNESFSRRSYFAFVPQQPQGQWFGSKSPDAFNYFPRHEIGNILSYDDSVTNNPDISQELASNPSQDGYVVDASSTYSQHWEHDRFTSVNADTSRENGFDAGAKYVIEATYDFSKKKVSTSKTTIKSHFDLEVNMGALNPGYSTAQYWVLPYAYWSKGDALVLDYSVRPSLGGGIPTWWQEMYGDNPDPTFVLPWRLDPEKGYGLTEEDQRFLSKSISFSKNKPDPGDTLTITAQVRNFSLVPTQTPVSVKFYLDDPDSGGTAIIGVNGTNEVSTSGTISARGRSDVEFKWVIPNGLPTYARIYAILDRDNNIAELHEDNNKGFNILGIYSTSGIEEDNSIIPEEYALYQSYPNPFNPSTTIKYSVPQSDIVSIKVYDILGSEVAVLTNEYKPAGTYSVEFNASRFASGVYFYQIHAGNFIETKKMVLLK